MGPARVTRFALQATGDLLRHQAIAPFGPQLTAGPGSMAHHHAVVEARVGGEALRDLARNHVSGGVARSDDQDRSRPRNERRYRSRESRRLAGTGRAPEKRHGVGENRQHGVPLLAIQACRGERADRVRPLPRSAIEQVQNQGVVRHDGAARNTPVCRPQFPQASTHRGPQPVHLRPQGQPAQIVSEIFRGDPDSAPPGLHDASRDRLPVRTENADVAVQREVALLPCERQPVLVRGAEPLAPFGTAHRGLSAPRTCNLSLFDPNDLTEAGHQPDERVDRLTEGYGPGSAVLTLALLSDTHGSLLSGGSGVPALPGLIGPTDFRSPPVDAGPGVDPRAKGGRLLSASSLLSPTRRTSPEIMPNPVRTTRCPTPAWTRLDLVGQTSCCRRRGDSGFEAPPRGQQLKRRSGRWTWADLTGFPTYGSDRVRWLGRMSDSFQRAET